MLSASSARVRLERMGVEESLTNLTREFKKLKAPAAKKFGKKK